MSKKRKLDQLMENNSRNHRVTLVANHLHISTSGGDVHENDVFLQTLDDVKNLEEGRTSDIPGLGGACTHIAGLLFGIEYFLSRGFKGLPDAQATTEPKALREVSVEKNVPGRLKKEKQFRGSDYNPLPEKLNSVNYDSLSLLHHTLSLESPNLPWVKAVAPAIVNQHKPQKLIVITPAKPTLLLGMSSTQNLFHHNACK
ncbi:hypothetical protein DPMN_026502 [Dreissena polymorpha]|uniref:Uncharacterized protein n=1 Tax=Dreissena polymorpha TaxID=45954 RepID=A0A9D4LRS3_DREPO|nr:hypothetical protein DPMN_026502 [Dreissena polymorpha]